MRRAGNCDQLRHKGRGEREGTGKTWGEGGCEGDGDKEEEILQEELYNKKKRKW